MAPDARTTEASAAGAPDPLRPGPHEPYSGRPSRADADADATSIPEDGEPPFLGEFEQRSGEDGSRGAASPRGEVRSRSTLREALQARLAAEPSLAGLPIEIEVGAQGVRLHGSVPDGPARARLLQLLDEAGYSQVDAAPRASRHTSPEESP